MSLRVWLPLNGDLRNNGLSNVTSVDSNLTIDNVGKIGKCYSFNGSSSKITNTFSSPISSSIGSLACWVKFNAFPASNKWFCLIQLGNLGGYATCRFGLYMEYSNTINISIDGSGEKTNNYIHSFSTGVWYHLCTTYDGTTVKLYINGNEVMSKTATKGSYTTTDAQYLYIGGTNNYYVNGYMNDARYYDHALSAKEVKELSKGLVCHYTLNDIKGQENLFNWGNKGNEIITLNNYQNTGSFTQFTNCLTFDAKDTVGTTYTISFWAKSPNGTTSLLLYNNNSTPRYFYFSPTTLTTSLNNEWQYFTYTFTNQDRGSGTTTASTYNRIEIYMPSKMGGQVKLIKIEEGEKATSWSPAPSDTYYNKLGYDKNIIYDTSGNKNNATPKNITYSSNTARNTLSAVFNGTNSFIACGRGSMVKDEITINFWGYSNNWTTLNTLTSCTEGGGFSISRVNNNIAVYMGTGTTSNTYKTITSTTTVQNLSSGWHMFTVTYDGLTLKFYIDGILDKTNVAYTTKTPIFYYSSNGLFIGAEASNNQVTPAGGYSDCQISDYRIYGVALTEDDIKELYQVGASIDKDGNVFAYEFKED